MAKTKTKIKDIPVGVIGVSGYTGTELLRLLLSHPNVRVRIAASRRHAGKPLSELWPHLGAPAADITVAAPDDDQLQSCEVVFFSTPHGTAMQQAPDLLRQGVKVIDLSADFRLRSAKLWRQWYGLEHSSPEWLDKAVYGLPELFRASIVPGQLVANPGCYPTAAALALAPLLKEGLIDGEGIIVDAKSGTSGAGRQPGTAPLHAETTDSFHAYNASGHRHLPELQQVLDTFSHQSSFPVFVPHLTPMRRGIFVTAYARSTGRPDDILPALCEYYADEEFVTVLPEGSHPKTTLVQGGNSCALSVHIPPGPGGTVIVLSVIDNLVKGAAGQAVQNMNLMFGWDEGTGLRNMPLFP